MPDDRQAGGARESIRRPCAQSRVTRRDRDAGRVAAPRGTRRGLPGAVVRRPDELRDHRVAPVAQRRGLDGLAPPPVARLGRVEDLAGVDEEGVVADGLEGVADERVETGAALDAPLDGRELIDLGGQVAGRRGRVHEGLRGRRVEERRQRAGGGAFGRRRGRLRRRERTLRASLPGGLSPVAARARWRASVPEATDTA